MVMVGMADLNSVQSPGALTTLGLGSCVGITLWDPVTKVAGMAHCMLPDSSEISNNSNIAKFVDTALIRMINDMVRLGANKSRLKAKLAGGAQMFALNAANPSMRIGDRNVEAAKKCLRQAGIPIVAEDTGDSYGRTIELHSDDGRLVIKTVGKGNKIL